MASNTTYGDWMRPMPGGIRNIGIPLTIAGMGVLTCTLLVSMASVVAAIAILVVGMGVILVLAIRDREHRNMVDRAVEKRTWMAAQRTGANLYRSGLLAPIDGGKAMLPGILSRVVLTSALDGLGREFCLVRHAHTGEYSLLLSCQPQGASLADDDVEDSYVASWAGLMESLASETGVTQLAVTVDTAPDSGVRFRRTLSKRIVEDAPELAARAMAQIMDQYAAGGASNDQLIREGATVAFLNIFGNVFGNVLNLFVAISCLGTMNGLMLGCVRGLYSLAARKEGPRPEIFSQVDSKTNMAHNSSVVGLLMCGFWGLYFYLANLAGTWQGAFVFDSSELPIITIYAMYIPIFIQWIRKQKDESVLRRFILPILSICGAAAAAAALTACGGAASSTAASSAAASSTAASASSTAALSGNVATGGSTSMKNVIAALTEGFAEIEPDVTISYDPTGSGAGITGAADKTLDIGLSSRALKDDEKADVEDTTIALDGIAIIVNNASKVEDLTVDQIKGIYTGELTTWADVQ